MPRKSRTSDPRTPDVRALGELEQSLPEQLHLFRLVQNSPHSNLVDLYDAAPKYLYARPERTNGRIKEPLQRTFDYRDGTYKIVVRPAFIQDQGKQWRDYLPGEREELIEDALRKFATSGRGVYLGDGKAAPGAGVVFSLMELQRELASAGHTYSFAEIKHGLRVCAGTGLTFLRANGDEMREHQSNLFAEVGFVSRSSYEEQSSARCFVRFHPLVTASIDNRTFRRFNYETSMRYRRYLSRWLHKRLSLCFTKASEDTEYKFLLSFILRNSGCAEQSSLSHNVRAVKLALEEMVDLGTLAAFTIEQRKQGRRLADALFSLQTSRSFIEEMIESNKIASGVRHGLPPVVPEINLASLTGREGQQIPPSPPKAGLLLARLASSQASRQLAVQWPDPPQ